MGSASYISPPKIAIAAHAGPGGTGGVARFIESLIHGLGKLTDGEEEYLIVVQSDAHREWLEPLLGPNQQIVFESQHPKDIEHRKGNSAIAVAKRALGPLLPGVRRLQRLINIAPRWPEVPISDGFYEALGCDVLHIPNQPFFLCAVPTIYNPHDLQHLHYPQFWDVNIIAWREVVFRRGCEFAQTVVVGSQWVKDDVQRRYRIEPDKIQVIFEAPTTEAQPPPTEQMQAEVRRKYEIGDEPFALYPAAIWEHKNHIRLLEALAFLRDVRGQKVKLVCTGALRKEYWPRVELCLQELNLAPQVKFVGLVPGADLKAIYSMAQFMIMPTLYEAISLPIFEAWEAGIPVTCSDATALPEQVRSAALMFDPFSSESIATAVARMASESALRSELQERGRSRLRDFTWERTAKAYRAVYRRTAGFPLSDEDRWLLSWDWVTRDDVGAAAPAHT
jgi:glycosyltransferase involved in cell wall biosynthesis